MSNDSELLIGLSEWELEALADSLLAPSAQARLDELLEQVSDRESFLEFARVLAEDSSRSCPMGGCASRTRASPSAIA